MMKFFKKCSDKLSFPFPPLCCISRRSGILVVGILDVILGILCILATTALLIQNLAEQNAIGVLDTVAKSQEIQDLIAGFVLILISCGLPAFITFFLGVVTIYSAATESLTLTEYSVALSFLLIVALLGISTFLYFLGLALSLLLVYIICTGGQIYCALIIYDFYKFTKRTLNLHNRRRGTEDSSEDSSGSTTPNSFREETRKLSSSHP